MPFVKEEVDGQEVTTWVPPTPEEIKETHKSIYEGEAHSGTDTALTDLVREKIDRAVQGIIPTKKWGIIVHSNEKVYDTIKAITSGSRGLVDILIPVHNSIHITKQCIKAVLERTNWPFHITILDDASDQFTHDELYRIQQENKKHVSLITNHRNMGFAATINKGIKNTSGEFVCLLNSDVMVTDMWLTKMLMAHKADPKNQIVCPATNNTAIVNVALSPGASYIQMNRIFEQFAVRQYPEIMPTGFCFLFPRSLTKKIGLFDEGFENFGEESDFWMRAVHYTEGPVYPKYRAVMADDTYVFHERGSSFSQLGDASHMTLRRLASGRFNQLWPQFQSWQKTYSVKRALGHIKDAIPAQLVGLVGDYHICWVVHSATMCGGMRYIADIVNGINEKGGNARVALIKRQPDSDESYIGELRTAPVVFQDYDEFVDTFPQRIYSKGIVVAATAELVGCVKQLCDENSGLKPLLHTQSYEPELMGPDTPQETLDVVKLAFKALPNVISNSKWISEKIEKELGVNPFTTISPGVDQELFYPRDRSKGDDRPTIMMPMLSKYPCKGFNRGLEFICELEKQAADKDAEIRILTYGDLQLPIRSSAISLGPLSQTRLAHLLGTEVDLFLDPSTLHSYGLPALEAVASGVPVISWNNKGVLEYLDQSDAMIFENKVPAEDLASAALALLLNEKERKKISAIATRKVLPNHSRQKSVAEFIEAIEKHFNLTITKRRIVVVVPHMRKHGGPTTMIQLANELAAHGHNVSITTVYTDINPEVAGMTDLEINIDAQGIPKCDVLITNSDNPMAEALSKLRQAKKKIMLKLSHNPRFKILEERGLNYKWDAIVTSSQWLKDACENPTEGWNYPSVKATRIGWWHYGHENMAFDPNEREWNDGQGEHPFTIGFLVHAHPSKGTPEIVRVCGSLFRERGSTVKFTGIGEIPPGKFGINLPSFRYKFSPNRTEMADIMQKCDVWIGASQTEGLGRMALEAMSAGCACVLSDTGAEYAKHGENCLLYPIGDTQAMLDAIRLVLTDGDLRTKLIKKGFETAEKLSDPESCMENLERVIRELF